ncbi:hypothetical protein BDZ88DRAFT_502223 [Geranomyces variabilis]|nr:hypothetical protein BDZ88DRAFT_502223 [Geranomyces variabilis]KAJ3131457.1 hypothetical protein HDU90_008266 [Geranomyces variabilis]
MITTMNDEPLRSPTSPTSPTFFTSPELPAIPLDVGDVAGVHGRIKFKHDSTSPVKRDATWLDRERAQLQAYEYLCHIGEAKEWIEACIKDHIAPIESLEEELRNGIDLARLARSFKPECVKKIYEDRSCLKFRHSDNINYFFAAMRSVRLPEVFFFELTDLYDKKNIPKVIYCIHALSHLLSKKNLAPSMKNLVGQLSFTEEQLDATQASLQEAGVSMPAFKSVGDALSKELETAPSSPVDIAKAERDAHFVNNQDRIVRLQAFIRGHVARQHTKALAAERQKQRQDASNRLAQKREASAVRAQAAIRMHLARKAYRNRLNGYKSNEKAISKIQAQWKSRAARKAYKARIASIKGHDHAWAKLQANFRGRKQRELYNQRKAFLHAQGEAVEKIQAMWRAKRFAKAYHALSQLQDPQINVLQNFLDLLDDNDNDFQEDLDIERLRQLVVEQIRESINLESEVGELDIKISLLVKNRITLEEVVRSTTSTKKLLKAARNEAASADNLSTSVVNLAAKDRETTRKRRHYEELFYLLQTQSSYLARLVFTVNKMSGASSIKFLTKVVLSLYGYAQDRRQESLLLRLFKDAIDLEVDDISTLDEFWRADPFFLRLVVDYTRRGGNADYLRGLVKPFVKAIIDDKNLNLETDPVLIYRSLIAAEESQTGQKSSRPYDVTPQQASEDSEVIALQAERAEKLRRLSQDFLEVLTHSAKKMPFGLRYIARHVKETLQKRFAGHDDEIVRLVGGNFIYYRYINPAIIQPEQFEVIDLTAASGLSPTQRKNLAELGKALHQLSVGKVAGTESGRRVSELSPQTTADSSKAFMNFFKEATIVEPEMEDEYAEAMDEYVGMALKQRPSVKLSSAEIFQLHRILVDNINDVAKEETDHIRVVLADLEPVPALSEVAAGPEVELHLRNRFPTLQDERAIRIRTLWTETKRYIIAVIRVQSGKNLLDILEAPVTEREEALFQQLLADEAEQIREKREAAGLAKKDGSAPRSAEDIARSASIGGSAYNLATMGSVNNLGGQGLAISREQLIGSQSSLLKASDNGGSPTFFSLKRRALENMAQLEADGEVSKRNKYQDMLNAIAKDMLTKSRRRARRRKELISLRNTLKNLQDKSLYLEEQKKSYHDYISACMAQLGNKKHKGKRPLPFTKQYAHHKSLQKAGTVPKFGSFKYTAADLHRKGVLISLDDHSPSKYNQVALTISSDEAGVFNIEASFYGVKVAETMELRLEDLLAAQYNNEVVMTLMEGAKVNVNLLIFLLNKKFYV